MLIVSLFRNPREAVQVPVDYSAQRTVPVAARTEARQPAAPLQARHRRTLAPGNALSFTSAGLSIRVLSGSASLVPSVGGVELAAGEERTFSGLLEGLTVLADGSEPLAFEVVLDASSDDHLHLKEQFYAQMAGRLQLLDAEYTAGYPGS